MMETVRNQEPGVPAGDPSSVTEAPDWATAALALADGTVFFGHGAGATGTAIGELCFNTAMPGRVLFLSEAEAEDMRGEAVEEWRAALSR